MKNKIVIALVLTVLTFPAAAFAITPGERTLRTPDCHVWREGQAHTAGECNTFDENRIRLYDLEVAVQKLEAQNQQLQSQMNTLKASASAGPTVIEKAVPDTATIKRVDSLETRVSSLEKVVAFLQDKVLAAVNKTIELLNKLLTR